MMADRKLSPEVEQARAETQRVIDRLAPYVYELAAHVEQLERVLESERETLRSDRGVDE